VTVFDAAGSRADGPQGILADRVSAGLTAACLFLVLALAVTLIARPRHRARPIGRPENARPIGFARPTPVADQAPSERCAAA
jgi:hypothetical protein